MRTLKDFVRENRIRMTAEWADSNPNMTDMPAGSTHYRCRFRRGNRQMTVPFSMGPALRREPTAEDVLNCLASDACGADQSFEDWCEDCGFDTDSRKAESIYKAVQRQSAALNRFLGPELTETLIYRVER